MDNVKRRIVDGDAAELAGRIGRPDRLDKWIFL